MALSLQSPINIANFNENTDFILKDSAIINGNSLQLTSNSQNQEGLAIYKQAISSAQGASFTFGLTSSGGSGADGTDFFLLDGDKLADPNQVKAGSVGGGLGYSTSGANYPGITNGFLGVGFDTYGNYEAIGNSNVGIQPNSVGLRGEGSGSTGYNLLSYANYQPGIDGNKMANVSILNQGVNSLRITVSIQEAGATTFTPVLDTIVNQTMPSQYYFGFSASTGGLTDNHLINSLTVSIPVTLALGAVTVTDITTGQTNPAYLNAGDRFQQTYTVTNSSNNQDNAITIQDSLPANVTNASWSVTDSSGTTTGTGSSIPVNLLANANASIVISGQVDPNASSGNANNLITLLAGSAYTNVNFSNTSELSQIRIGADGGGSVSLIGANSITTTSDKSTVQLFPTQPKIVDTFVNANGANTGSVVVSIDPSKGSLSATNAVYSSTTGQLTAQGTIDQIQAVLASIIFTPIAYQTAAGQTNPVAVTVKYTATEPGNTTGMGGEPTAVQTSRIDVVGNHTSPQIVLSGNPSSQDNATSQPFQTIKVTDNDLTGAQARVIITKGNETGDFTAASAQGWTRSVDGNGNTVYSQTFAQQQNIGSVVQKAFQTLEFQPDILTFDNANPSQVNFTLSVTDTASIPAMATQTISLSVSASGADNTSTVYRFFNTNDGSHFFTASAKEVSQVKATRPDLTYEGKVFGTATPSDPNSTPVYRFFSSTSGDQFLTSNLGERDQVIQTRPDLKYEGVDFNEHINQQADDSAIFRFFNKMDGTHLYTASTEEKNNISSHLPNYIYEGVAFYTPAQH